jgi:hypothetical protein
MAQATEIATTRIVTKDGVVTATVLDRVSVDHISLMLTRGSAAAIFSRSVDNSDVIPRSIKDLIVFPFVEE